MQADFVRKAPFIVIDGLDGCGKGTQIRLLGERAKREERSCAFTREPGGAPLAEELRELFKSDLGSNASALTQLLMVCASRRECLEKAVWPLLEQCVPVISDRCDSSTLAYQIYALNAPELEEEFWRLREVIFGDYPPSIYIFIGVPPNVARGRVVEDGTRGSLTHFDAKPIEFYERVYKGFCAFANHPSIKTVFVDGTRTREEIHEDIYRIVSNACGW